MAGHRALLSGGEVSAPSLRSFEALSSYAAERRPREGAELMRRDRDRLLDLERHPERGPSLHVYRWARPTISLGWLQREDRVLDAERVRRAGIPVVRRPTGGRAILHADEWTWSMAAPIDHPLLGGTLHASLRSLTVLVVRALASLGAEVAAVGDGGDSGGRLADGERACFAFAAGHEIVAAGRKLAGSAQRRLTRALLVQGTLLVGPGHERLADLLVGDDEMRARTRGKLEEETVTLTDLLGARPEYERFTEALGAAWSRAVVGGKS